MSQENIKSSQEQAGVEGAPKPFDPKDTERIAELEAKFEGKKDIERYVDLIGDSQNITGTVIKDFSNPNQGRALDKSFFEAEGLIDGAYARNNNSIVFMKGDNVYYIVDSEGSPVSKKLEETGFKKVEGVGVPSLGDPGIYYNGLNDSTFNSIQEKYKRSNGY